MELKPYISLSSGGVSTPGQAMNRNHDNRAIVLVHMNWEMQLEHGWVRGGRKGSLVIVSEVGVPHTALWRKATPGAAAVLLVLEVARGQRQQSGFIQIQMEQKFSVSSAMLIVNEGH